MQPIWAASRLVFIDESGFRTNLTRRGGWAPRGHRCVGHVLHGTWQTTPFIGALRTTGLTAPLVLDGPLTTEAFRAYVTQFLCPMLPPGDRVILDTLAVHEDPVSAQHIAQTGATRAFLPPYSPDLNPIELVFAKFKALARGAATRPREELWAYLGSLVPRFSPHECQCYFRHCGYT